MIFTIKKKKKKAFHGRSYGYFTSEIHDIRKMLMHFPLRWRLRIVAALHWLENTVFSTYLVTFHRNVRVGQVVGEQLDSSSVLAFSDPVLKIRVVA